MVSSQSLRFESEEGWIYLFTEEGVLKIRALTVPIIIGFIVAYTSFLVALLFLAVYVSIIFAPIWVFGIILSSPSYWALRKIEVRRARKLSDAEALQSTRDKSLKPWATVCSAAIGKRMLKMKFLGPWWAGKKTQCVKFESAEFEKIHVFLQ